MKDLRKFGGKITLLLGRFSSITKSVTFYDEKNDSTQPKVLNQEKWKKRMEFMWSRIEHECKTQITMEKGWNCDEDWTKSHYLSDTDNFSSDHDSEATIDSIDSLESWLLYILESNQSTLQDLNRQIELKLYAVEYYPTEVYIPHDKQITNK